MSARTELADALDAATPESWQVDPFYRVPDGIEAGCTRLIVYGATWRPGGALGLRQLEAVVWLIVPELDPELVDDELDARLATLLDVLDSSPVLAWSEAERGTLDESYPGYRVTLTTQHRKA